MSIVQCVDWVPFMTCWGPQRASEKSLEIIISAHFYAEHWNLIQCEPMFPESNCACACVTSLFTGWVSRYLSSAVSEQPLKSSTISDKNKCSAGAIYLCSIQNITLPAVFISEIAFYVLNAQRSCPFTLFVTTGRSHVLLSGDFKKCLCCHMFLCVSPSQ